MFSFIVLIVGTIVPSLFSSNAFSTTITTNQNASENQANNTHPSTATTTTMDRLELELLFNIMETLSSDQKWRVTYPNPCHPGSSWPGIECKVTQNHLHVTRLDFGTPPNPTCKKTATFPPQIFQLPFLESIFIFQCFTHTPTRIFFPPNTPLPSTSPLQQLSLRSNPSLIGTIPPLISSLKSLQILTLSQNKLTGPIPGGQTLIRLTSLLHLDLSYNMLTGPIPFGVGNLISLVGLDLSYNKLTGPIPFQVGKLGLLQKLDLSSNSLTGTIPGTFKNLNSLVFLALSNNKLRGQFFARALTGLKNLEYFLMDDNPMFVPLPAEFGQLKKLQELRLSNSGYSGSIPLSYSGLTNLTTLSLQNNRLSGQIPVGLGNLSRIYHLNLSRNFLDGVVPFNSSFLNRLGRNLDLSGNPELCLSPLKSGTSASAVDCGVGYCGKSKNGSLILPLKRSEAPMRGTEFLFIVNVASAFLTLHHVLWSP